jgi:succinate dehydrogenase flavin-adding protein (antitoxin of CptAB toxin-antitoxin module)
MKELDLLLLEYLRGGWQLAPQSEREAFAKILELPDPVLAGYLLGNAECTEDSLAPLLAVLRTIAARGRQSGAGRDTSGPRA